jgi:replicative DNA helicase
MSPSVFDGDYDHGYPDEPRGKAPPSESVEWEKVIPLDHLEGPAFPVEALPAPFLEWSKECAEAIQVPVDLPAMLDLSLVGAAASKKFQIVLPNGHVETPNLWVLAVLESGERKSATFREAIGPLNVWRDAKAETMRHDIAEYWARLRACKKSLERSEDRYAKSGGDWTSPEAQEVKLLAREFSDLERCRVVEPRLAVDDISPEKLCDVLGDNGGRILIASPEGGTFDLMAGRYSPNATPNLDIYLKGYSGDDHLVDRVGREGRRVESPLISMALTAQPEVLRGLAKRPGFRGRGIIGRLWYSIPKSRSGYQKGNPDPIPTETRDRRALALQALLDIPTPEQPYKLVFEEKAAQHRDILHDKIQARMRPDGDLCHMRDWALRAVGGMVRLSGILHLMEHATDPRPWDVAISPATAFKARAVMEGYLVPHAQAAIAMMGANPNAALAESVVEWIQRHAKEEFTRADLHRDLRRQVEEPSDWDDPIQVLIESNHVRLRIVERDPDHGPGRRPMPTFEVNPELRGAA